MCVHVCMSVPSLHFLSYFTYTHVCGSVLRGKVIHSSCPGPFTGGEQMVAIWVSGGFLP